MKTNTRRFGKLLALAAAVFICSAGYGSAQEEEDELDPLGDVIADMQVAGGRLAKTLTDKPTQQKQQDAVDKLNTLIKLLEERRGNGGQISATPDRPANESTIRMGPGGSGPLHAAHRNGNAWGHLPAHKRQEILQSMTEGFPAHYQPILERYFQRLAEERTVGETSEGAAPPAAPAIKPTAAMDKGARAEKTAP